MKESSSNDFSLTISNNDSKREIPKEGSKSKVSLQPPAGTRDSALERGVPATHRAHVTEVTAAWGPLSEQTWKGKGCPLGGRSQGQPREPVKSPMPTADVFRKPKINQMHNHAIPFYGWEKSKAQKQTEGIDI